MKSRWDSQFAASIEDDLLELRSYTSRLLGQEASLVQHGGGNTSAKGSVTNIFGEEEEVLYVKGSGWDLASIQPAGFAPVKLEVLKRLAHLDQLSDIDMVTEQRKALLNPKAPNPSVEAILHAIIPFKFVDHTHSDAVVTLTNTPKAEVIVKELYGDDILVLPYVMPGFVLAKQVFEATRDIKWENLKGIILLHHGVFTFHDDAKTSYENMLDIVTQAENYLSKHAKFSDKDVPSNPDFLKLSEMRKLVSKQQGKAVLARLNDTSNAVGFSMKDGVHDFGARGTITPDHSIHIKPWPAVIRDNIESGLLAFSNRYEDYFNKYKSESHTMLNSSPKWAIWQGRGLVSFGENAKRLQVVSDISKHTIQAVTWGEALGGWKPLDEKDLFEVEYWELEQAKLKKASGPSLKPLEGKVALVTGAASGIGKATVEKFVSLGACVTALDINEKLDQIFESPQVHAEVCDVTNNHDLLESLENTISDFGGLDILVLNAGIFPKGEFIEVLDENTWDKSLQINLTSNFHLLKMSIPYLKNGIDPSVVFVASKNVQAPGPGAAAYSVAKAGLTQLARVAALELAPQGIRVNTVHPDAVFDTGIWTDEVLANRAKHYGMTVDEYKRKNLLKAEIGSHDVAELISDFVGAGFNKITGAQVPLDGGNERTL